MSGSGSTGGTVNGMGNLVIGYAENPKGYVRTGSNDLIVGTGNGWTGFGEIAGGANNRASGPYATTFGLSNIASGMESAILGGHKNSAATNCRTVPRHRTTAAKDIRHTGRCPQALSGQGPPGRVANRFASPRTLPPRFRFQAPGESR
ncbi:MAG TPA: hypothetical protein VGL78_17420 [Solirubrobacteraceae bacterium]